MNADYERWVAGYEGRYSVTTDGRVFSHKRGKHKELSPVLRGGYYAVNIAKAGKPFQLKTVHRLVALTFIDGYVHGLVTNHKDADKTNNHIDNLEWCTPKQNTNHAWALGLNPRKFTSRKPVMRTSMERQETKHYVSLTEAMNDGFSITAISNCLSKRAKTHAGYVWTEIENQFAVEAS